MFNFIKYVVEGKEVKQLEQVKLSYARDALEPVLSEDAIDYHYGKLYRTYVNRFNAGEGDLDFNEAGAFLHSMYFPQLQIPDEANTPIGASKEFIDQHFKSFENFKEEFTQAGLDLFGSGWVWLVTDGTDNLSIITTQNQDNPIMWNGFGGKILLGMDVWEHAYYLKHQADRKAHIKDFFGVIDWDVVEARYKQ